MVCWITPVHLKRACVANRGITSTIIYTVKFTKIWTAKRKWRTQGDSGAAFSGLQFKTVSNYAATSSKISLSHTVSQQFLYAALSSISRRQSHQTFRTLMLTGQILKELALWGFVVCGPEKDLCVDGFREGLLGAGVLGYSLGALRHGVLGQLPGQQ